MDTGAGGKRGAVLGCWPASVRALAIPGIGLVVAAGWLVATYVGVGAASGGLVGSLTGAGVS
jgi:hypothetical protein